DRLRVRGTRRDSDRALWAGKAATRSGARNASLRGEGAPEVPHRKALIPDSVNDSLRYMDVYRSPFEAVADPTRRAILVRLSKGPISVGELAAEFPVSRPAISHHLRVLKDARLVTDTAQGTRRRYEIDARGLQEVRDFFEQFWNVALAAFKRRAEETP